MTSDRPILIATSVSSARATAPPEGPTKTAQAQT
jgi:hypothetical protein